MTSKNYLAKGIKENLRRNLWLMLLLLLVFLGTLPIRTLMELDQARHDIVGNVSQQLRETMENCVGPSNMGVMVVIICGGAFLALSGFFYLYSQEKTDFYHSLPVKRPHLFIIQYISGLIILCIPYLLCLALALVTGALSGAVTGMILQKAFCQAVAAILFFLCFYGTGILAILLTGNLFMGALGFGGILSYGPIVYAVYVSLNNRFFHTLADFGAGEWTYGLSPVLAYLRMTNGFSQGNFFLWPLLYGAVYGILIFLICLLVYGRRPSESFQKAIAFKMLEPVIKVCIVVPGSVAVALFFSGRMYGHNFLWMCLGCLASALVLLGILDFLFTLDIRKCLKPGIASGVSLALLAGLLLCYRLDLLGVDSYFPKKSKIETMSVYLNSICGNLSYPENAGVYQIAVSLDKNRIENFDDIYELAGQAVASQKDNESVFSHGQAVARNDQIMTTESSGLGEDTMVSIYIGYHLKSGRDVYRKYDVPESQELVENIGRIYDDWEYRKTILPTSYVEWDKIQAVYTDDFLQAGKKLEVNKEKLENIFKTYKGELESLTFAQSQEQAVIGYLTMEEQIKDQIGGDYSYRYQLPVYESFDKTRALLEEAGNPMPKTIPVEEILDIQIGDYTELDENGEYKTMTIEDDGEIENILQHPTFMIGRYGVGSELDYDHTITIRWKNRDKESQSVYLWKEQDLGQLLDKK